MKCTCGGNLKRIAVDCYECELCGFKQAIGFLKECPSVNTSKIESPTVNNGEMKMLHTDCNSVSNEIITELEGTIYNMLGINKKLFNNKYSEEK